VKRKVEHINLEQVCAPECVEFKIYLEDLMEEEVKEENKKFISEKGKRDLAKIVKKAELNARYVEELRNVRNIKNQILFRNYGVF
jgi:sialic acid synthase SpsE